MPVTCIAGIADGTAVWLAGDSAGVVGISLAVRADPKVFTTGPYVIGYTTSFRNSTGVCPPFTIVCAPAAAAGNAAA